MAKKKKSKKLISKIVLLLILMLLMAAAALFAMDGLPENGEVNNTGLKKAEAESSESYNSEADSSDSASSEAGSSETGSSEVGSSEEGNSEMGNTEAEGSEMVSFEAGGSEENSSEAGSLEQESSRQDGSEEGSSENDSGEDSQEPSSQNSANSKSTLSVTERAQEILDSMTLTEQIYQMFIVKPEQLTGVSVQTQAGSTTQAAIEACSVGGIVYFAANIQTRDQVKTMISNTQSYSKTGLFIAVDEEGGTVARIGNNSSMGTTSFPNMKTIGNSGDTNQAYNVGYTIGSEIAELGFNLDFAPVADVDSNPDNPVIGNRAFSSDASVASDMVSAAVRGFNDNGMLCTLKHFPGHGDTATDSHAGYTELNKSLEELWEVEFVPFQGGINAGADFVMVGHISVPQVTGDDLPASLSGTILSILRDDLGFDGLIITDSMQMEAITDRYTSSEAAVMAIQAGVDIILMPEDLSEAVAGVEAAVEDGTISRERIEDSVLGILKVKIEAGIIE